MPLPPPPEPPNWNEIIWAICVLVIGCVLAAAIVLRFAR